jgi:hypothetical protein
MREYQKEPEKRREFLLRQSMFTSLQEAESLQ